MIPQLLASTSLNSAVLKFLGSYDFPATVGGSMTQASANIGQANAKRLIIVVAQVVGPFPSAYPVSCTIGGVAATLIANAASSTLSGAFAGSAIFALEVASGTTANIVVTFNQSCNNSGMGVYALYNYQSPTPFHVPTPLAGGYASRTIAVNEKTGGVTILAPFAGGVPTMVPSPPAKVDFQDAAGYGASVKCYKDQTGVNYTSDPSATFCAAHWR